MKIENKDNKRPLTPEQEAFCLAYTTRGENAKNGTFSYAFAYNYDLPKRENGEIDTTSGDYRTCQACASKLLLSPNISARIKEIYLEKFNDISNADARIQEIIEGGKDTDAIQAVKVYNDLKQRITKKIDITTGGRPLAGLTDDELKKLAE
jgi:hypothetical protein